MTKTMQPGKPKGGYAVAKPAKKSNAYALSNSVGPMKVTAKGVNEKTGKYSTDC